MKMQRNPRHHDEKHLAFLRTLPCIICADSTSVEAAHIRMGDVRIAKNNPGVGAKPDDYFCLPLCGKHHGKQHEMNERTFWKNRGIDPILYALALYAISGDYQKGFEIVSSTMVTSDVVEV